MFTIGIDVGGTYTDLVAIDESGAIVFAKSPSTPADQSIGVMAGLEELARRLKLTCAEMLAVTDRIVHGTTVATNALLERKGAVVALLTTEGHRDIVEMREGLKDDRYDLRSSPPEPIVPRELRFGVRERLKASGEVATPLHDQSLDDAIAAIHRSGATSVAICFLHSYLNPVHEIAAVERLTRELPGVTVSRSSDVLPQIKEFERVSTTIVNAYVMPLVLHYLTNLKQRLVEAGFKGSLFIILSHGGMAPAEEASRLAAGTVLSGPAGGISGAKRCADLLGIPDLVSFDMGRTCIAFRRRNARGAAHRIAQSGHRQHRGRRWIYRQRGCRADLARGSGKRGLVAGAGLLRQWRYRGNRHRCKCCSRLS
jgi:N-methylhydantoinase A